MDTGFFILFSNAQGIYFFKINILKVSVGGFHNPVYNLFDLSFLKQLFLK